MEENKTVYEQVRERHYEKKVKAADRKEERVEQGIVNKLVIDRTPSGLFTCRYSMRGGIPEELKGSFTRKDRILAIAARRGIQVEDKSE